MDEILVVYLSPNDSSQRKSIKDKTFFYAPQITPPSAEFNPNILKSNIPPGAVFIVVGAAAVVIFAAIILWYIIIEHISRRDTKKIQYENVEKNFHDELSSDVDPFYSTFRSNSKLASYVETKPKPLLDAVDPLGTMFTFEALNTSLDRFSDLEEEKRLDNQRKSMYISPTIEFMNQKRTHRQPVYGRSLSVSSHKQHGFTKPNLPPPGAQSAAPRVERRSKIRTKHRYAVNSPVEPPRPKAISIEPARFSNPSFT